MKNFTSSTEVRGDTDPKRYAKSLISSSEINLAEG